MKKPIAVYYIRYSSNQQEQSDSVRRQMALIESYAKANDLAIDEQLSERDLGVSGFRGLNLDSGLGTIKKHIQEERLLPGDFLLLENLDRFSRHDIFVSAPALFEIINAGIKVVTVANGEVFSNEGSGLMTMMQSIMQLSRANDESLAKSIRGKEAWEEKRNSFIQGTADRIMTSMCPNWLKANEEKTQFVVIEERKEVVERIFNLSDQGIGSISISKILNNEEIPTFGRAKFWQKSAIDKILKSRAVLGECEFFTAEYKKNGKKKRVPTGLTASDYYPPIIDLQLFDRVQMKRTERKTGGGGRKGSLFSNLFTGLVKCGECRSTMQFINKGKPPKGGTYLKCRGHEHGTRCRGVNWRYDKVENLIVDLMRSLPIQDLLPKEAQVEDLRDREAEIQQQDHRVKGIEARISKLLDALECSEGISVKSITERISTLEKDITKEQSKLQSLQLNYKLDRNKLDNAEDRIKTLRGLLESKSESKEDLCVIRETINARLKDVIQHITFCSSDGKHNPWGGRAFYIAMKNTEIYACRIDPKLYLKWGLDVDKARELTSKITTGELEIKPIFLGSTLTDSDRNHFEKGLSKSAADEK